MKKGFNLVAIALGIVVAGIAIGAVGVPILNSVNTTGWATTDVTIFGYVKTFMILSLLIAAIGTATLYGMTR